MSKHRLLGVDVLTFAVTKSVIESEGGGSGTHNMYEVVEELPTEDISDKIIYLVKNEEPVDGDEYVEYAYVNGKWEKFGKPVDSSEVDYEKVTNKPDSITKQQIDQLFN